MPHVDFVIGTLVEVPEGQALIVESARDGKRMTIFCMDPAPFRGHEGEILAADFNLGFHTIPALP